jgi:hypothetical protein
MAAAATAAATALIPAGIRRDRRPAQVVRTS